MSDEKPTAELSERDPFLARQVEVLSSDPEAGREVLGALVENMIGEHPDFQSFKDPDFCHEGVLKDEEGTLYIQKACRCKDGAVRALQVRFEKKHHDEMGGYDDVEPVYAQKDFTEEFPF